MTKGKIFLIVAGIVGAGAAVYFIFRKDKSSVVGGAIDELEKKVNSLVGGATTVGGSTGDSAGKAPGISSCSWKAESWPLAKCMKGPNVKILQQSLNSYYGKKLVVDGLFGDNTWKAVFDVLVKNTVSQADFNTIKSGGSIKGSGVSASAMAGILSKANNDIINTFI